MSYADFASAFSVMVVAQYVALVGISIKRARFRDPRAYVRTESVASHARLVEGPVATILLIAALWTTLAAFNIGRDSYALIAALFVAFMRGVLGMLGIWLLALYWKQRRTWLGHQ